MAITPEVYDLITKIVEEKVKDIKVTHEDFNELKADIWKSHDELKTAIAELAKSHNELRDAVTALTQDHNKLRDAVTALTQDHYKLRDAVTELIQVQKNLSQQVGKLSDNIGFGLEDIARVMVPSYVLRHYKISIPVELERTFFKVNGKEVEINLYAPAKKGKMPVSVLGESKARIYEADVSKFLKDVVLAEKAVSGETFRFMFGYYIHPSAQDIARKNHIVLVASYQR